MKKWICSLLALLLLLGMICTFASCGNKQLVDTTYTFNYALVRFPDGTCAKIELDSWADYEGEQIQIKAKDGKVYLVHAANCVLVKE